MIKTENLTFVYGSEGEKRDEKRVIDDLSIEIKRGSFVAVLGHNGSGKSTLAKHFNAILLPEGGRVYVNGMDTGDERLLYDIRRTAGMVFQNPDNQIVATIVEDEVAFAPENLGVPPEEIRKRVDECLRLVGMSEYAEGTVTKLSGGQKQRIAIASVLAMQPECIVLDEPTAMLDPKGRKEVMQTIKMLNKTKGMTVVLITHYMDEAAEADRIIVMQKGRAILDDVPKNVFRQVETLKGIGLDVPQVTELVHILRERGFPLKDDIIDIDECAAELARLLPRAKNRKDVDI